MANNKPKKTTTAKSKAATAKKAPAKKATEAPKSTPKKSTKSASAAKKTVKTPAVVEEKKVDKVETKKETKEVVVKEIPFNVVEKKASFFKTLFGKKRETNENILTIFKDKKIWGALIAEVFGTVLLSIVLLTLGVYQPLYIFFVYIGITLLTFGLSGANLNPIVTAGMMATRRMSAIRGVLYMIAQILGAWVGFLVVKGFCVAAGQEVSEMLPKMAAIESESFWLITMIEFLGAVIIGLTFARALQYKRSALTFAMVIAGGFVVALIAAIVISSTFASLSNNFIMNPAIALMYQILPTSGADASAVLGDIAIALATYVVFPVLGGIIGFGISDIASTFSSEKMEM